MVTEIDSICVMTLTCFWANSFPKDLPFINGEFTRVYLPLKWKKKVKNNEPSIRGGWYRCLLANAPQNGKIGNFFFFLSFLLQNVFLFTEVEWHFGSWLSKSARRNKRVLVIAEQTVEVCNRRPPPILFSFFLLSLSTNEAVVKTKSAT